MTPKMTINLMRALFVAFAAAIGSSIGLSTLGSAWIGVACGTVFGLVVVLADRECGDFFAKESSHFRCAVTVRL